jgi:hypothetical protein
MDAAPCNARPTAPYVPWAVAVLAALALAGALAAAVSAPAGHDLAPRHTAGTLRATAI